MEPVYTPVVAFARLLFAAQGLRFRITGEEHIPRTGGAVVAMNHLSYLDFTYAGLAALPARRLVRFMAKDAVFHHPVSGPLMRGMKHIPVDRESGAASFRHAVDALRAGELVGVFPEATISRSFELKGFKTGAVRMAQEAGVPIVPIVLWGSQRVWTKGHPKRLGRTRTPISVNVCEPLHVELGGDPTELTAQLHERMEAVLRAAQEAYPRLTGDDLVYLPARMGGTAPTLAAATELDRAESEARRRAKAGTATPPADPPDPVAGADVPTSP